VRNRRFAPVRITSGLAVIRELSSGHTYETATHRQSELRPVADVGGSYWLFDEIALAQRFEKKVAAEPFQVWKLAVHEDRTASLVCGDGNDNIGYTNHIPYTDFPVDEITLWFANNTIYLPSEH